MRYILLLFCVGLSSFVDDHPAYQLYWQKGKAISYAKLLKQAAEADVVLFGELHNNPICHWLELRLTKDLYAQKKGQLVLGAEMVETDNQAALSSYVEGSITDKEFAKQARLWPNYDTDYRPLVDFARINKIPFVATNVPRRYATLVSRQGLAALDTVANKKWLVPLPLTVDLTLPGYKGMMEMMADGPQHGGSGGTGSATATLYFRTGQQTLPVLRPLRMQQWLILSYRTGRMGRFCYIITAIITLKILRELVGIFISNGLPCVF